MVSILAALVPLAFAGVPDMNRFLAQHDLVWEIPPARWLDGIPLANGDIGALIWGDGKPLIFTLDKYDAWETREAELDPAVANYANLRKWLAESDNKRAEQFLRTQHVYAGGKPYPTRLPMPRLELTFGGPPEWKSARLHLHQALAEIEMVVGGKDLRLGAFVHARRNLLVLMLEGAPAPDVSVRLTLDHLNDNAKQTLKRWGYPDPEITTEESSGSLRLPAPSGFEYAAAWTRLVRDNGNVHLILLGLASGNDHPEPLAEAKRIAAEAAGAFSNEDNPAITSHQRWWSDYWKRSFLTIPDARLEALYYAEIYKLGCSSRPGKLPITLQGLWTLDGGMPPWSGDYHLDMNVQQSYWPIYTANRLELGRPLYDTFSKCLPRWKKQCKAFFGFDGAWSGCAIGPGGQRVFGYSTVEFWPGNAAWLAHHYWLHFLYSQDKAFLENQAMPMIRACFLTYANLLEKGEDGRLHLPVSYSPEWGEGSAAGFGPDPTVDIALIRFLAKAIGQAGEALGQTDPLADRARQVLAKLTDLPQRNNRLLVRAGQPLSHSHRHHSHLIGIHPLEELTIADGPEAVALIRNSLHDIRVQGFGQWTGWAFPWMSSIAARAGYPNMAFQMLDIYADAFITPNTFHVNGDPRHFGVSLFTYEPMTLEAGFGAAAAVMEMLLQSWRQTVRVFPALPDRFHDAYFANLRAQGAFLVTAKRVAGRTRFVRITSEAGLPCKIMNPFDGAPAELLEIGPSAASPSDPPETQALSGTEFTFPTRKGHTYLLFPKNRPPSAKALAPLRLTRPKNEHHFFGFKKLPRF